MLNILHIAAMAITFLVVFNKAEFTGTRLVALVPLGMLLADVCSVRADFMSTPVLAVIMAVSRLTVVACCVLALRRDRAMARARDRQRLRHRMVMRTAAINAHTSDVYDLPQYA